MNKEDCYKDYLGDGVYAEYDGYHLILSVEDGKEIKERIYLEPDVLEKFFQYHERLKSVISAECNDPMHQEIIGSDGLIINLIAKTSADTEEED